MPTIILKEYQWSETIQDVNLTVPVPGITVKNLDVFMTANYIKISCAPYMWEIFLKNGVNSEKSVIKVGQNVVQLRLIKEQQSIWNEIAERPPDDKKSLFERRQHEISEMQKLESDRKTSFDLKKQELNHFVVEEQMKLEENDKQRIKEALEKDKKEALKMMFAEQEHSKPLAPRGVLANIVKSPPPQPVAPPRRGGKIVIELTEGKNDVPTRENIK